MFTGIVQGKGVVVAINDLLDFRQYTIELPSELAHNLQIGASIANNGCCLTIIAINGNQVTFDLMKETLAKTNLGQLTINDLVNIERAARFGDEIGGHLMSGHITTTATISNIDLDGDNCIMTFTIDNNYMKYIIYKGFIGIDGASLTVGEVSNSCFKLHLIPETLTKTTLGIKTVGDNVNIEFDPQTQTIVDTVERILQKQFSNMRTQKL